MGWHSRGSGAGCALALDLALYQRRHTRNAHDDSHAQNDDASETEGGMLDDDEQDAQPTRVRRDDDQRQQREQDRVYDSLAHVSPIVSEWPA